MFSLNLYLLQMKNTFTYQKEEKFSTRYIQPKSLFKFLQENLSDYISEIGKSGSGLPIYMGRFGDGTKKIIAWSQMHGNESTATHAMLDLLKSVPPGHDLWKKIQLDFIFMLNPDGSELWTRQNGENLDINRDFNAEATVEMKLLKKAVAGGTYDFALNLHDQRTIFTTDGIHPATLSFLSPSQDAERNLTENRKKSMAVIAHIFREMQSGLRNRIGRYSDEFYPNSCGDNFMLAGLPNVLFEGGHFEADYKREFTRKFYTMALYAALEGIVQLNGSTEGFSEYFKIPENQETHYDVVYRNVRLNTDFDCVLDVAVQYREVYSGGNEIDYVPYVVEVGKVSRKGWEEIDCSGMSFISASIYPKLDEPVNFSFSTKK